MRKLRIALGILIADISGIIIASVPTILLLSFTDFSGSPASGLSLFAATLLLLISLSLFLFPFQLLLMIAQVLRSGLDKYGIFSVSIIGGLIGGSLFYFLIFSHFILHFSYFLIYLLLGVFLSILIQSIYLYIPQGWKIQPVE
jgi:hypothetical protein